MRILPAWLRTQLCWVLPAIAAGFAVTPLGLRSTFEIFGSVIAGLALVVAFEAWRTRPRAAAVARPLEYDMAA